MHTPPGSAFTTRLIREPGPDVLDAVIDLEARCFAASWHDGEEREFYGECLADPGNVGLFLLDGDEPVGFALAVPNASAVGYLREFDPEVGTDPAMYYLETIQVHPSRQGRGGAKQLMAAVLRELAARGVPRLAMHARVTNGLNRIPRSLGAEIHAARAIPSWKWGGGEPYEYLEIAT